TTLSSAMEIEVQREANAIPASPKAADPRLFCLIIASFERLAPHSPLPRLLAQVFVRLRIDADVLADADEQGHLDGQAASQFGILENVAALMARGRWLGGLHDFVLEGRR